MNLLNRLMRRMTGNLSCEEANAFLAAYVDGELDPDIVGQFELHIRRCVNCRRYLEQYRMSIELASELEDISIPDELLHSSLAFLKDRMS